MSFVLSNHGIYYLISNAISGSLDLRCLVCSNAGNPSNAQIEDMNFVSDMAGIGLVEVTNTNYARQDLLGVTVTEDDINNWVQIIANAPYIANVGAGDIWKRVLYYVQVGADSANPVIGVDTPVATITPSGDNVSLPAFNLRISYSLV